MSLIFSKVFQDGYNPHAGHFGAFQDSCRRQAGRFGDFEDNWHRHAVRHRNAIAPHVEVYLLDPTRRHRRERVGLPIFRAHFTERETDTGFEIRGELPGFEKKDISIEFTDRRTLAVSGHFEHVVTTGTPPDAAGEGAENAADPARVDKEHQATVQDEDEAEKAEEEGTEVPEAKPADNESYSVKRSVQKFSRSFTFSTDVDQDTVKANLKNGILTIEVPKVQKQENHRISVD